MREVVIRVSEGKAFQAEEIFQHEETQGVEWLTDSSPKEVIKEAKAAVWSTTTFYFPFVSMMIVKGRMVGWIVGVVAATEAATQTSCQERTCFNKCRELRASSLAPPGSNPASKMQHFPKTFLSQWLSMVKILEHNYCYATWDSLKELPVRLSVTFPELHHSLSLYLLIILPSYPFTSVRPASWIRGFSAHSCTLFLLPPTDTSPH